jgi:hypothetical protein
MILPWMQLEPALKTLFKRLSNLPVTSAPSAAAGIKAIGGKQSDVKLPAGSQQADVEFAIISDVPVGQAELRSRYDEDIPYPGDTYVIPPTDPDYDEDDPEKKLGTFIDEVNQNQQVTIQVTVSCGFQKTHAYDYANAMRNRLHLPSARAELRTMGLALAGVGKVLGPLPELDPNFRDVGKYAFEMVCNGMTYAIDAPVTTIETADIETEVAGP